MATQTTIAAALQDKIDAKAALKTIINNRFATNITNEKLSEYPAFLQSTTSTWVRPADWLEIDSLVTAGEQKTVGLYAIYPNNNTLGMTNKVAFTVTGNHTIDWGDGSALENVNSNVQAEHTYNYDNISSETACSRGYRQVRITITPQSGQNITNLQFGKKHSTIVHGRIFSQWLDINISGTELTTFRFSEISYANLLEKIKVYQVTNKCTSCANMFQYCYSLQSLNLSSFNTAAVTNMSSMFYNCTSLQSLNLSSFNTAAVTNMGNMFQNCNSLQSLNLSSFNTAAVTNMGGMFQNCTSLQSLNLSSFNTAAVTNMGNMFYNCTSLQSLNLSSFNTAAVTNMSSMFYNCNSLQSLNLSSFNTAAVTNMGGIFQYCNSLQSLNLSSFNTAAVTNMSSMFYNCYSLQSLNLSSFNTAAVTNMSSMFYNCTSLQSLDLSATNVGAVTSAVNFANGTTSLIKCRLPQAKWSFTVANNPLSATELNLLFGDLAAVTGQTIAITGCTGASTCDKTIATNKGWTVTG